LNHQLAILCMATSVI